MLYEQERVCELVPLVHPYSKVQKYWVQRNIHLLAWTVNSKEEADKLVAMGIPVLTDDVAMMK